MEYIKLTYINVGNPNKDVLKLDGCSVCSSCWCPDKGQELGLLVITAGGEDAVENGKKLKLQLDELFKATGVLGHICVADAGCRSGDDIRAVKAGTLDLAAAKAAFVPKGVK